MFRTVRCDCIRSCIVGDALCIADLQIAGEQWIALGDGLASLTMLKSLSLSGMIAKMQQDACRDRLLPIGSELGEAGSAVLAGVLACMPHLMGLGLEGKRQCAADCSVVHR